MFTLVVGIIFLLFKFSLSYNDIYYYFNVASFKLFNNNYFRVSIPRYKFFLMVTCCRKVLTVSFQRVQESVKV